MKCKGHASDADVQAGRSTPFKQRGNSHADHYAGGGATIAEHAVPAEGKRAAYREARRWYTWIATLACDLPQDTTKRVAVIANNVPEERVAKRMSDPRAPMEASKIVDATPAHLLTTKGGRLTCELCRRFVSAGAPAGRKTRFSRS